MLTIAAQFKFTVLAGAPASLSPSETWLSLPVASYDSESMQVTVLDAAGHPVQGSYYDGKMVYLRLFDEGGERANISGTTAAPLLAGRTSFLFNAYYERARDLSIEITYVDPAGNLTTALPVLLRPGDPARLSYE